MTRDIDRIGRDLAELRRMKKWIDHEERELSAELWRAREAFQEREAA